MTLLYLQAHACFPFYLFFLIILSFPTALFSFWSEMTPRTLFTWELTSSNKEDVDFVTDGKFSLLYQSSEWSVCFTLRQLGNLFNTHSITLLGWGWGHTVLIFTHLPTDLTIILHFPMLQPTFWGRKRDINTRSQDLTLLFSFLQAFRPQEYVSRKLTGSSNRNLALKVSLQATQLSYIGTLRQFGL